MSHNTDDKARSVRVGAATSCNGKVRFDSYALALGVAKRSRRGKCSTRTAYACGLCRGFHLGEGNGAAKAKRRTLRDMAAKGED